MPSADAQVAIAGAGPAGARAAALLAQRGLRVEVFDAGGLARPKLCGGLLNRRCQQLLAAAGLALPDAARVGAGRPGLEYPALEYHDLVNRRRGRYQPGYRNIDRGACDAWLRDLAREAGAVLHPHSRVRVAGLHRGGVDLQLPAGRLSADWLLDASGSSALSRRQLGPGAPPVLHCLQGEVRLDPPPEAMWAVYHPAFAPLFAWIIPKGDGCFLIGAGFGSRVNSLVSSQPSVSDHRTTQALPDAWNGLRVLLDYLDWRGHRVELLTAKPRGAPLVYALDPRGLWWGTGRVYALGEAAGLASPFSGEGISFALASAQAATHSLVTGQPPVATPSLLRRELTDLRRAQLKAWVATRSWLRPAGFALLPLAVAGPVAQMPWRG